MTVPAGHVRLVCDDPKIDRTLLLADTPPKLGGGVGGWEIVGRPRQTAMTVWQGTEPYSLELAVMIDRREGTNWVERVIYEILTAGRGDEESEPSTWQIDGIPHLRADEWVLNGAEPGDQVIRQPDMRRTRQDYVLSFVEYVPAEYVQIRRRALKPAKRKTVVYIVKRRDTPASIARKRRCKWTDLRELNKGVVKKANQNLKDGSRIRVPVLKRPRRRRPTRPTRRGDD